MGEEGFLVFPPPERNNLEANDHRTITLIGSKFYVIEGGANSSTAIQIIDKSTAGCTVPTVLGNAPSLSYGHFAFNLNDERILIIKKDATLDDIFWFLEVDTDFVKEHKQVQGGEVVAWSKGVLGDGPKPIVISGPSGVGKGTLISKLMKDFPSTFGFSVSHTTRAPREKEINGIHYHFTNRSMMEKDISEGKFLEYALVHGNLYGTSVAAVQTVADAGKRCILDIDVQGARSVRASSLEAIFIFVRPPSVEELEKRLRARGTETEEQIQKRLRNARTELDQAGEPGLFDHILVNDDLEICYAELKEKLSLDENSADAVLRDFHPLVCNEIVRNNTDEEFLLRFGRSESEGSGVTVGLDLSSIEGGTPGQTRGLAVHLMNH